MRYGFGLLVACLFTVAAALPGFAADMKTYTEGAVKISLPKTWKTFDKKVRDQVSAQSGGGKVLLLAEAPAPDFLKITVAEAPASMNGLTSEILGAAQDSDITTMCKGYIEMVNQSNTGKDPNCGRALIGKNYVVSTSFYSDAQGPRPALGNATWIFPRGDKSTIVTFLYKPDEKAKFQPLMREILGSVVPGPTAKK